MHIRADIDGTEYQMMVNETVQRDDSYNNFVRRMESRGYMVSTVTLNEVDLSQLVRVDGASINGRGNIITISPPSDVDYVVFRRGFSLWLSISGFGNEISDTCPIKVTKLRANADEITIAQGIYGEFKSRSGARYIIDAEASLTPADQLRVYVEPDIEVPQGYVRFMLEANILQRRGL